MMEETSSIYWTLLETDTDNPELYLPPGTPVGGANPKKLYSLYQKRHARQKERLIKQQVAELYKYREKFTIDLQGNDFMHTPSTVCELISGTDFLSNEGEAISQLLSKIPNFITQDKKQKRSKPDNTDNQKQDYLEELTKRFKAGSGDLEKHHQIQLDSLERIQKSDFSNIPKEFLHELDPKRYDRKAYSSSPESLHNDRRKSRGSRRDDNRDRKRRRDDYRASSPIKDNYRERDNHQKRRYIKTSSSSSSISSPSPPPPPPPPIPSQRKNNREPIYTSLLPTSPSHTPSIQPPTVSIVGIPTNTRPPTVFSSSTTANPNNSDPSTVKFSSFKSTAKPPTVGSSSANKSDPPTVQTSSFKSTARPSSVSTSSAIRIPSNFNVPTINLNNRPQLKSAAFNHIPPYIAQPSSQFTRPNDIVYNERRPSTPLFTPRPPRKIETLMDKGALLICTKPSRVLIRQPNGTAKAYGNPKDYDDAIHSRTTRPDNPVYKRHMNGIDYLFYKSDTGNVVTVGPVSKIQPMIHKFFLSI